MNNKDVFQIHILLNGLRLPLEVRRDEEEIYREAEKIFNNYLEQYRQKYSQRSMEEILTIVTFQVAVILAKQNAWQSATPLAEKIEELNNELKALLEP